MSTRTGSFLISFRRGGGWQKELPALLAWARSAGFDAVDLTSFDAQSVKAVRDAGLRVGSVDLGGIGQHLSADAQKRKAASESALATIRLAGELGCGRMFNVLLPDDRSLPRADQYQQMIETFAPLAQAAGEAGVMIVIEGWPGPAPAYPALACTPETVRAMLRDLPAGIGLNYDPSHLVRLGVDPVRFLREFIPRVGHVHAKDTQLMPDALYEYGLYQPAAFVKGHGFGEQVWRYTIPGHGVIDWPTLFGILKQGGYAGAVSVELEDENFNGSEAGEKQGLERSVEFLKGA